jgi:hypothetical protein
MAVSEPTQVLSRHKELAGVMRQNSMPAVRRKLRIQGGHGCAVLRKLDRAVPRPPKKTIKRRRPPIGLGLHNNEVAEAGVLAIDVAGSIVDVNRGAG